MLFWGNIQGWTFALSARLLPYSLIFLIPAPSLSFLLCFDNNGAWTHRFLGAWQALYHWAVSSVLLKLPTLALNCEWSSCLMLPGNQVYRSAPPHSLSGLFFIFFFFYCFLPNLLSPGPSLCISLSCDLCFSLLFSFLPGPCIQLVLPLFLFFFWPAVLPVTASCLNSDFLCSEWVLLFCSPLHSFPWFFFFILLHFFLTWDESWLLAQLPLSLRNSWVYKSVPPHQYLIKMDLSSSVYVMDFVVDVLSPGCCCLVFVRIYL